MSTSKSPLLESFEKIMRDQQEQADDQEYQQILDTTFNEVTLARICLQKIYSSHAVGAGESGELQVTQYEGFEAPVSLGTTTVHPNGSREYHFADHGAIIVAALQRLR